MIDRGAVRGDLRRAVESAVAGGVDRVQVRDRELEGEALLALTDDVMDATRRGAERRGGYACVLVNRRVDVALAAVADGVHLGFDAMGVAAARDLLGEDVLIGRSTHAPDEIDPEPGLSYVHLAPVFAPLSKPATRRALGLDALGAAARRGVPVIAQGGIDATNARAAIDAGASGVAVTGAVLMREDPAEAAREIREALDA